MSRSRVTSEFRELLDESGVEYAPNGEETVVKHNGKTYRVWAYDNDRLAISIAYLTPEQAIAATLGSDTKPCYAADENYKRCKYSVNRGWCDDAPFLVWDDTGHLFITMGGLKTWDVTDDAKKWFAELGSGTCEMHEDIGATQTLLTCSECGYTTKDYSPTFCGGCGARIRKAVER